MILLGLRERHRPPSHQIPDDRTNEGADEHLRTQPGRDELGVEQPGTNGLGYGRAIERPDKIGDGRQQDGQSRRQHLGGNHRGDRVGRIVKAVDVFEHQRDKDHRQEQRHRQSAFRSS